MGAPAILAAALLAGCSEPTAQGASGPPRAPSAEVPALAATAAGARSDADAPPTADAVRAATKECKQVSTGLYALDARGEDKVPVCGREGAVFWTADLDVDCDGRESPQCNKKADPDYQSETAAHDSHGDSLDAAAVPYVVVPGVSDRWSYKAAGLRVGHSVVAVIYKDRIGYGVIGDVGPKALLGEASYAMAKRLGMDPDPKRGGAESGVLYVAFTGTDGEVQKPEDTAEVDRAGKRLVARLARGK